MSGGFEKDEHVSFEYVRRAAEKDCVQAVQQLFVPPEYRVAVANGVSYFWDTYLAMEMSPSAHAEHDDSAPPSELAFSR